MGLLENKQLKYDRSLIRANSVKEGDTIEVEKDLYGVVLDTHKTPMTVADDDADTQALISQIKEAGEQDKVSPNFDEIVTITVAVAFFNENGSTHIEKRTLFFPEWGYVHICV